MLKFDPKPVTLENDLARLEPIAPEHAEALFEASQDEAIWRYMPIPMFPDVAAVHAWIDESRALVDAGTAVVFAIVNPANNRAVGSTRFFDFHHAWRNMEIGWTWLGKAGQRTGINTANKLLLLSHAFDDLGAIRVQIKTDSRNERSQRAIERIGATREGVLRNHMIVWDGHYRDTVMYSVTIEDWPRVRENLKGLLDR